MDEWSEPDLFAIVEVGSDSERSATYEDTYTAYMEFSAVFSTSQVTKVTINIWDEDTTDDDFVGGFYTWTEGKSHGTYQDDNVGVEYSISYF